MTPHDMHVHWVKLKRMHMQLSDTAMKMFAHPEATDEMILSTSKKLIHNRAALEAMRKSLLEVARIKHLYHMEASLMRGFE